MRKSKLKEQVAVNQQTINALVRQNDLLSLAGNEMRSIIADKNVDLAIYKRAFQNAAGRLAAHNGISPDEAGEFAAQLIQEAVLDKGI